MRVFLSNINKARDCVNMSTVSSFEGDERKPKGAVLFTGPDGIGDYKVNVSEQYYIGTGFASPEASSDTQYLWRAPKNCPHHPPKMKRVGEVGWGVPQNTDYSILKSGHQIMLKDFRQAAEDRHTHLYQTPYYPPPEQTEPVTDRRETLTQQSTTKQQETGSTVLEPTQSKSSVSITSNTSQK